jgi:hypothetical protein
MSPHLPMKKKRSHPAIQRSAAFEVGLRQRAAAFLNRPVPLELQPVYVAGSVADRVIAACVNNEAVDPELRELAELAGEEYGGLIAAAQTEELRNYYVGSRALLAEIVGAAR